MLFSNNFADASTPMLNASFISNFFSNDSVAVIIQIPILSVIIIFVIGYTVLILLRPTLRKNKLNWFTINVCVTSAFFAIIMLETTVEQLLNVSSGLSCRSEMFLVAMASSELMYSHCVFAISRFFAIVYAHKRIFRSNECLWCFITLGWIVACLVALPYLFVDGFLCFSSTQSFGLSSYTLISILFLPIIIVTVFNGYTLIFVRNSTRWVHAAGTPGQVSHKRDVFLVKITIGTFITFLAGWTPSFTIHLFNKSASIPTILNNFFEVLPALTVLHDVLLLIFTNQPVRTLLKQFIIKIFRF